MKSRKKIILAFLTLLLGIMFAVSTLPTAIVNAADDKTRIVDWADLLSDSEEAELSDKLDEISER